MRDGLYQVNHGNICGGFVVRRGKITVCAPVLRKQIEFFKTKATFIPTDTSIPPLRLSGGVFSSVSDEVA